MKVIIVFALALVAAVSAAPVEEPIKIIHSDFTQQPEGSYNFSFESENGIIRQEDGQLKEVFDEEKKPHQVVVVRGSYQYPVEGGKFELINFYADETGFHPEGDSIPKPNSKR